MEILKKVGLVVILWMSIGAQADQHQVLREQDKLSYSIGMDVARNFKKNDVPLDADMVMLGIKNGLAGERPLLSQRELRQVIGEFQSKVRQRMAANTRVLTADNRKRAEEFLQKNKNKEGVSTLSGGLQYKVLQAGQGALPQDSDTVLINYRGSLLDGTQFDSTELGNPGKTNLYDLFDGLRAGIRKMAVGSHWILWIPPQLGYGERGVGNDIGPNELLIYDVELVGIAQSHQ